MAYDCAMQWHRDNTLIDYESALTRMEQRVAAMIAGEADELGWLLEHPPLYTGGTSAKQADLLDHARFPVYETGRGGQYTYHGPGQRICYLMLNLKERAERIGKEPDLRAYVQQLERWVIAVLATYDVEGFIRDGRVGVWVNTPTCEKKIAALGIRVRKWVTFHGIALNVEPDLSHYQGIVPCGISEFGVTSLADLGIQTTMEDVDQRLQQHFARIFGA